jgi:hypothetical protein
LAAWAFFMAVDTQNFRHLGLELGVAAFQIVAHLVRLDFLLTEKLAHGALSQTGETLVTRRRSVLARMAGQLLRGSGRDSRRELVFRIPIAQRKAGAMRDEIRKST